MVTKDKTCQNPSRTKDYIIKAECETTEWPDTFYDSIQYHFYHTSGKEVRPGNKLEMKIYQSLS